MTESKERSVGYGSPPVATRFKPGRSGNPRGRPRGSKNCRTILARLLEEHVQPKPMAKRVSRFELMLKNLIQRALEGDWAALKEIFSMMMTHDTTPEPYEESREGEDELSRILEEFEQSRTKSSEKIPCSEDDEDDGILDFQ